MEGGGVNCIKTGVHCLHYIEHQDCTATWAMSEISEEKLNKYSPPTQAGLYTQ